MGTIKEWLKDGEQKGNVRHQRHRNTRVCGGVAGLTYYVETTAFFNEHEADVWKYVREAAEASGSSVFELLDKDIRGPTAFKK
jgi:hypothetical protein